MHHRHRVGLDGEVLPEPVATHLLARACELDAARLHGTTVAELRAAAAEAGISPAAFDAALDELQDVEEARLPDVSGEHQPRTRRWALAAGVSALIAAGTLAVLQDRASSGAAGPMTEEAFLLRCLSPGDVAELVRPLGRDRLSREDRLHRSGPADRPRKTEQATRGCDQVLEGTWVPAAARRRN